MRADLGRRLSAADGDALFAIAGLTVHSVRDQHDPAPGEIDAASGGEGPEETRVERLFRDLWVRKHDAEPDEATMAELSSALAEVTRVVED
jgi:hypothetical protein